MIFVDNGPLYERAIKALDLAGVDALAAFGLERLFGGHGFHLVFGSMVHGDETGSLPAVVEADDQGTYVLKFRGAGQGPKALIAELVAGEPLLDRELRPEGAEERRDAHHHQRGGDGLGVGDHARRAVRGGIGQHLQRHQRVVGDHLADGVGVDVVLVLAHGLDGLGRLREHRHVGAAEVLGPGGQVAKRSGQRCIQVRHGEPRGQ